MRALLSLLTGALFAVTPARAPKVFSRVLSNGAVLSPARPTLALTGPFTCADNAASSELDCACPNTGVLAQGIVQFTLQSNGQMQVDAPWVTANTIVVCTPIAPIPIRVSIMPGSINPGVGFTVLAQAPDVTLGSFNVGCIGAVPSP